MSMLSKCALSLFLNLFPKDFLINGDATHTTNSAFCCFGKDIPKSITVANFKCLTLLEAIEA